MESLIRGWNGEMVVVRVDRPTGAWIVVAIHSTRLGPATGGTRLKPYRDARAAVSEALALARAMTYKFAAAGFPRGGGKAVVSPPGPLEARPREDLLRRYGSLLGQLHGLFRTGPDVGTSPTDMDVVAETGAPYVHSRSAGRGGGGDSGAVTARGVLAAMQAVFEKLFGEPSPRGRSVLVQGAGGVGAPLVEMLQRTGAQVAFSDPDPEAPVGCARARASPASPPIRTPGITWCGRT